MRMESNQILTQPKANLNLQASLEIDGFSLLSPPQCTAAFAARQLQLVETCHADPLPSGQARHLPQLCPTLQWLSQSPAPTILTHFPGLILIVLVKYHHFRLKHPAIRNTSLPSSCIYFLHPDYSWVSLQLKASSLDSLNSS